MAINSEQKRGPHVLVLASSFNLLGLTLKLKVMNTSHSATVAFHRKDIQEAEEDVLIHSYHTKQTPLKRSLSRKEIKYSHVKSLPLDASSIVYASQLV